MALTKVQASMQFIPRNLLLNSDFRFWQRGTTTTVANGVSSYLADRWYVKNSLGTNGVITYSRQTASLDGSAYAAKLLITTAPTAAQANGTELYQTLENPDSLLLYNQNGSFGVQVKAFGNVNQVGVQFYYKTTEAKVDTALGSEQTFTVNTSGYVRCYINGTALGTSQTTSGVIGVRVRITGVSSGNTYDLNNGFQVEQGMLNTGDSVADWSRAYLSAAMELLACQRFYEKSYDITTDPGTVTPTGFAFAGNSYSWTAGATGPSVYFKSQKRTSPTITTYSTVTGTSGQMRDYLNNADRTAGSPGAYTHNFTINNTSATTFTNGGFQWTADAEI